MKNETAPSSVEATYSRSSCASTQASRLSQKDVLLRLFAPATYLPEPRNKHAIVVTTAKSERAVTHSQVENLIAHGIEQLKERGVKQGDKVVFHCENGPEFTSTLLACWALNAMVALIDYRADRPDVLAMSKKIGAKLLVTSKKLYKNFKSDTRLFTDEGLDVFEVLHLTEYKDKELKPQVDVENLDLDAPSFAILTSGTTGAPKTAVHDLRSLTQNVGELVEIADLQGEMTALMPLPISHIFGLSVLLVTQVLGAKIVLTDLDPVTFVKAVHRHRPELIAALPQFYGALLSAPKGFIDLTNAKMLLCGGAPLAVSLSDKFTEAFGKQLNNGYGSTESKLVALNKDGPPLCVGKPIGTAGIEIVNERDEILSEGKVGEVRINSSMLMQGYLNNEDETRKVLRNEHYYYTGDIGRLENGNLFVVGRKKDVILVGGVVVYAGEIEEVLRKYHEVKDVAVTPVSNKWLGQIVKASVVIMDDKIAAKLKSDNRDESLEAHRQLQNQFKLFCKQHLSRYKCPMKWEFFGPHGGLPKTLAGKVDKKSMSDETSQ